jgi:hypothetical protein
VDERPDGPLLAHPGMTMQERNITLLASHGCEVRIVLHESASLGDDGREIIGFFSGLDEYNAQVVRTRDQEQVLVDRFAMATIERTGPTIRDYENDPNFDEAAAGRLRARAGHFVRLAREAIAERGRERDREREAAG